MKKRKVKDSQSTPLVTISWKSSLAAAAKLMEKNRIRHLPVTDINGEIIAMLSSRDLNRGRKPGMPGFLPDAQVCEVLNYPVQTVREDAPLREAAQKMLDEKISSLLVTDSAGAPVGIVTTDDLLIELIALLSESGPLEKLRYSPAVGELLREARAAGI